MNRFTKALQLRLSLTVFNCWRVVISFEQSYRHLARNSRRARALELKNFFLSRWYHVVMNEKVRESEERSDELA